MILGETRTGKELFAEAIHHASPRDKGPFIPVNCGAIPRELVEAELLGFVKGAFTGVDASRSGLIEQSHQGTLFRTNEFPSRRHYPDRASKIDSPSTSAAELASDGGLFECPDS